MMNNLSDRDVLSSINNNGDTALHVAAKNNNISVAGTLLRYNVDQTIRNNQGKTPAQIAQEMDYESFVELL